MENKFINFWFSLSDKIRFLFVGGFNFAFSYVLFVILLSFIGHSHYQLNLVLSWILSSFVSFTTQRTLVFRSHGKIINEYFKCFTTWMVSYAINAILLEVNVSILKMNVLLAQFVAVGVSAIATYILFKKFAFKHA